MSETVRVTVHDLGNSDRAALRAVVTLFSAHGWRDSHGAALAVFDEVSANREGVTVSRLAEKVPQSFLDDNRVSRLRLQRALQSLAKS